MPRNTKGFASLRSGFFVGSDYVKLVYLSSRELLGLFAAGTQ